MPGGGLHFVADADIVIAASDATFLDPHVSDGQVVAYEGIALARKSPMESVLRMALVGRHERVSAARAYQLGILSQVVDPPSALRDAARSASHPPWLKPQIPTRRESMRLSAFSIRTAASASSASRA